jgi:hypothetical protein
LLVLFYLLFSQHIFACEAPNNPPFPPLSIEGGMVIFGTRAVLEQEGRPNPDMGLSINFLDCNTGSLKLVDRLPFLAEPGEIHDAFLANTTTRNQEIFIIHSVPFPSSGGVSLGSDYFTILVYHRDGIGFSLDRKLTDYFGSGADIVSFNGDDETQLYTYPYKAKESILQQLKAQSYKDWRSGSSVTLAVNKKTYIYTAQSPASRTGMYLIKGDQVFQENVSAGWISIRYTTAKKKDIRGWVLCTDVSGC